LLVAYQVLARKSDESIKLLEIEISIEKRESDSAMASDRELTLASPHCGVEFPSRGTWKAHHSFGPALKPWKFDIHRRKGRNR
jgi:hypothetical protein